MTKKPLYTSLAILFFIAYVPVGLGLKTDQESEAERQYQKVRHRDARQEQHETHRDRGHDVPFFALVQGRREEGPCLVRDHR